MHLQYAKAKAKIVDGLGLLWFTMVGGSWVWVYDVFLLLVFLPFGVLNKWSFIVLCLEFLLWYWIWL